MCHGIFGVDTSLNLLEILWKFLEELGNFQESNQSVLKVTVQFETEGNGQNEIVSRMDRSEVKL